MSRGLAFVLAVIVLSGCMESRDPQMQFNTAVDTSRTHRDTLEAVSKFIENTLVYHYNQAKNEHRNSDWTHHIPDAMDRVIADLTNVGFRATDAGRAFRIFSTIYVHEQELLTTWIEVKRNKARIVVAGCDESDSRQLIGRQLALATERGMEDGPIGVVHRSQIERTLPDKWVPCITEGNR